MPNQTKPDLDAALKKMPEAHQATVTEDMTSAGRLDKMLGSNSPLMKRARTQGMQQAQSRGLLNSSMAAGAAQGAMIDRAQPFALQDSNNLIRNEQFNVDARNQRGLLQSQLIGDSYKSNQNYAQQLGLNEQAYGFEKQLAEQQFGFQTQRDETQNQYARDMARLNQELQEAQAQGDFGREQQLLEQQADLQASRDARLNTFDRDMQRLNAELQEAQAANDFGRTQQLEQQRADLQASRDEQLFGYDMQNTERQAELQAARDQRLAELDADQARLTAELQEAQAANDFDRTQQLEQQQAATQEKRDKLLFAQNMESMTEEYGLRDELAQSEAERAMKELFATSTGNAWAVMSGNLTDLVAQASAEIQDVQMNPNIAAEDKETMIADIISRRDTDLDFQQTMYNSLADTLLSTGAFPTEGLTTPMRQQIGDIYRQELGREPDQAGLDFWAGQARSMDLNEIRRRIQQSDEATGGQ